MSNSSIDKWLSYDKCLNWNEQVCIIIGVVQGLAYLHHECNLAIFHLDIKPQNMLLHEDYIPKMADFELAKTLDGTSENVVCISPFIFLLLTLCTCIIFQYNCAP
jgi:serine/threonine protein kinase